MRNTFILLLTTAVTAITAHAQATDKHDADQLVYKELTGSYEPQNWHPDLVITKEMLTETNEQGIYIVRGDSFQVKSMRTDFYVREETGKWVVLNDTRYPMETMTNLLLNRVTDNKHQLELRHHQYGGTIAKVCIPMQNLYDLFARNMKLYCSVTFSDSYEIKAVLVMHHQKMDFIHMVEMKVPISFLATPTSTIYGELYTNIPQSNLKSIFREKKKSIK